MKAVLIFLACVAIATAIEIVDPFADRSLSSAAVDAIESARDQMPCGFPGMNIPPLAPLKIAHQEVNIDTPTISAHGSVSNLRLNGLNDFTVEDFKVNPITSRVTFRFDFKNVNVDTLYNLNIVLKKAGFTINMVGDGEAKFAIKDMVIRGIIKYSMGLVSGKIKVKTFELRTHIGDVESQIEGILGQGQINHKLNAILEEAVEIAINENEDAITQQIEAAVVPQCNSVLEQYSLADLIGSIGGGGGESGEGGEKEACIPPEF